MRTPRELPIRMSFVLMAWSRCEGSGNYNVIPLLAGRQGPCSGRGFWRTHGTTRIVPAPPGDSLEPPIPNRMLIRALVGADRAEWLRMRCALWPASDGDEHTREITAFLESGSGPVAVYVADREAGGNLGGFLEMGLRSYAEGCRTSPVPYIEGWYVDPDLRRRGVGEALVEAAEAWARERGHTEIASDTAPDNEASLAAHERLGFAITDRMVCFRKELGEG